MKNQKPKIDKTSNLFHDEGKSKIPLLILTLVIFTFIAYLPSLQNEFTNWDDPNYVTKNTDIQNLSFESIKNHFSEYYM